MPVPADHLVITRIRHTAIEWTRALQSAELDDDQEPLATLLAASIVEHRLEGAPQHIASWLRVHNGGGAYEATAAAALRAFLAPFAPGTNEDHLQGTVAEYLWHAVSVADDSEGPLLRIIGPKLDPGSTGGDGLTVRGRGDPSFTLWEIKKHIGSSLSDVIARAGSQLADNAPRYLTQYASYAQLTNDPELARRFATIVEAWIEGLAHVRAGVAVTTHTSRDRCFQGLRRQFEHLTGTDPCSGLLVVLDDLPRFARRVAEVLWIGL